MAILQGLIALLVRSAGKILNTAFSWATVLLFGKVPQDRQIYLSIMRFGSVLWLVALLGIIWPSFSVWLLTFIQRPEWVDPERWQSWTRLAMVGVSALIPL